MDKQQLLERLEKLAVDLPQQVKELTELEYEYQKRYLTLMVSSKLPSQAAREAEAIMICDQEGIYKPYLDKKSDVRILYYKKDIFTEMLKTLRIMYTEEDQAPKNLT